jgi:hypothetical protein
MPKKKIRKRYKTEPRKEKRRNLWPAKLTGGKSGLLCPMFHLPSSIHHFRLGEEVAEPLVVDEAHCEEDTRFMVALAATRSLSPMLLDPHQHPQPHQPNAIEEKQVFRSKARWGRR